MSTDIVNRVTGNWRTTLIGIIVLALAVTMAGFKIYCWAKSSVICDFNIREILMAFGLGYSFLMAKDSLLEGITLGLFKPKT